MKLTLWAKLTIFEREKNTKLKNKPPSNEEWWYIIPVELIWEMLSESAIQFNVNEEMYSVVVSELLLYTLVHNFLPKLLIPGEEGCVMILRKERGNLKAFCELLSLRSFLTEAYKEKWLTFQQLHV